MISTPSNEQETKIVLHARSVHVCCPRLWQAVCDGLIHVVGSYGQLYLMPTERVLYCPFCGRGIREMQDRGFNPRLTHGARRTPYPEGCKLVAHDTGDGWCLAVEDDCHNVVAMLERPEAWPEYMTAHNLMRMGFHIR